MFLHLTVQYLLYLIIAHMLSYSHHNDVVDNILYTFKKVVLSKNNVMQCLEKCEKS